MISLQIWNIFLQRERERDKVKRSNWNGEKDRIGMSWFVRRNEWMTIIQFYNHCVVAILFLWKTFEIIIHKKLEKALKDCFVFSKIIITIFMIISEKKFLSRSSNDHQWHWFKLKLSRNKELSLFLVQCYYLKTFVTLFSTLVFSSILDRVKTSIFVDIQC